tara:strand:+ start:992 stop:1378 length:387 start_codon:yes stop_codon:yes gene_type:complete
MRLPYKLKYATTIGFWTSIICLFVNDSIDRKIWLSYSFGISICGILMQIFNTNKSLLQNLIDYGVPLFITLSKIKTNKKYDFSVKLLIPYILYNLFTYIKNINLNKQYKNFNTYNIINIVFVLLYFLS